MSKILANVPLNNKSLLLKEANDFLSSQIGKSKNTKRLYKHILKRLIRNIKTSTKKLTTKDVLAYLSDLEKSVSRNTLRVHVTVLKTFFNASGYNSIAEKLKPIKANPKPPLTLSKDDIDRMIQTTHTVRDKLIILLLYNTGIRVSELVTIKVEDINFHEQIIRVLGKGSKMRLVLVNSETLQVLQSYLNDRETGPVINLSTSYVRQIVKQLAKKAGITNWHKIHPHLLRHAFAINWVKSGGDLEGLRRLLGHASLETSRVYLDYSFGHVKDTYQRIFENENEVKN